MKDRMKAVVVTTPGDVEALELVDLAVPSPGPDDVVIKVRAAAVNPVDAATRSGVFHQLGAITQPVVGLGWDVAGDIAAVGSAVTGWAVGTTVAAVIEGPDRSFGPYAEFVPVPAASLAVVPAGLSVAAAATVPLNATTAAQALALLGPAQGRNLLITGAAGAVGGYAMAFAGAAGFTVTGFARSSDREFVESAGARFTDSLAAETGPFDVVLDAASLGDAALAVIRSGGDYVGLVPSSLPPAVRDITIHTLLVRPDGAALATFLAATSTGALPARVARVFPLDDVRQAHLALAQPGGRGRIVLAPTSI